MSSPPSRFRSISSAGRITARRRRPRRAAKPSGPSKNGSRSARCGLGDERGHIVACGLAVRERDCSMHVAALDDGEVAQERPLGVLGAEARAQAPVTAEQLPQLGQRALAVRRGDETPTGPSTRGSARAVPGSGPARGRASRPRPDAVEDPVAERQVLDVADDRLHPTLPRQLDHPLRLVDARPRARPSSCWTCSASSPLAGPDLQHEPRLDLRDRLERDPARIRAGRPSAARRSGRRGRLSSAYSRATSRGVVQRA